MIGDQQWIADMETMSPRELREVDGLVNSQISGLKDGEGVNLGTATRKAVEIVMGLR